MKPSNIPAVHSNLLLTILSIDYCQKLLYRQKLLMSHGASFYSRRENPFRYHLRQCQISLNFFLRRTIYLNLLPRFY